MKIVHCAFEMETGGSQVLVVDLLNEMCKSHTVSLVIINNQYNKSLLQQLNSKVKVYYLNRKQGSFNPLPVLMLNRLLYRIRPHIIHCHEPDTSRYIIKTAGGKLVNTVHDLGLPTDYYHHYHLVAAISAAVFNEVASKCRCTLKTIYNGINADAFLQRRAYVPEAITTWRLVQVSRLVHHKKGHDILLHGLHRIVYEYGITNISLDLIGDGNSLHHLQSLVSQLELEKYVCFLGDKSRNWLFQHLADYHLLVQPSRFEGFGLAVLEGIAAGLPVLASNVSGPAEILPDIPGAFLFEPDDVAGCAKQISAILALYKANRISPLVQPSVDLVKSRYSLRSCAAAYLEAYGQLVNRRAS
jgi:glycosyltransferase involved in cell wall biosynthesis